MSVFHELKDSVQQLNEQHQGLREDNRQFGEAMASVVPRVEKLDRAMFGNGQPGVLPQMAAMQATQRLMLRALWLLAGLGTSVGSAILVKLWT